MSNLTRSCARMACASQEAQDGRRVVWTAYAAMAALGVASAGAVAGVSSDFATDADGWVAKVGDAFWSPMPNQPGNGYLRVESDGADFAKVMAPSKFVDTLAMYRNGTVTVDARIFERQPGDTPFDPSMLGDVFAVRLTVTAAGFEGDVNSASLDILAPSNVTRAWVPLEASMHASAWGLSTGAWQDLLANATEFTVSIVSDNALPPYAMGFDNFLIVPAPAGAALALSAVALGAPARRRRV